MNLKILLAAAVGVSVALVFTLLVPRSGSSELERLSADMAILQEHLEKLESEQTDLDARLEQRGRRREAMPEERSAPREVGSEGLLSPDADPVDTASAASDPGTQAEALRAFTDNLSEVLASESGEKIIGAAIAGYQYRQETERRQRMATAAIAVFAEKAGLGEAPTRELTEILLDSASEIRSVWASMRSGAGGPDMGKRVQENIARTRELRAAANEKARMLLSTDQFATFEEEAEELHDLVSGPRTRRSGSRRGSARSAATPPPER